MAPPTGRTRTLARPPERPARRVASREATRERELNQDNRDELPPLYHQAKSGKIHVWRVWTEGDTIVTEHGQVDGEKLTARKRATPKNVGRSNETTAEEQARLEAKSMWQKKRDHKYHLTP